ncbi:TetR/AcrR family transcriptional regulator [Streptomyces libani]|uniref:TetR family transcriptional regulator n=2 Tax=Streptomyces nigrescens TaxID=1920 RepID=A0A640TCG3_STRNI|nr:MULTISPECIES: TetR/AcrR family transcriptional regulator [Streptomyces]MCX5447435.1 TetR/AcrR family transcriptional regulator [Streptomyces libani]WAT96085.1 TetR/AcrR family transcriptional regulator [Streptomyces libani subsp. libani]WAU03835.1 TetR/AcrR family transcriptional regulator [Streptomyces nigrescens]WDT58193.1 TetR/AcrR family transcriptional regulator [Streptomyces sp. G7(2002)]GFE21409.1 TetR family transcriptional regulator [Streptomyces libani subsp. libani]
MTDQEAGLRARLVQVGIDLLTEEGVQALSLREIARRAGVSHGAPRRHFPTHLSLLSAIARQGFADLAEKAAADIDAHPSDPRAQLMALGRGYLDFALTHRGMFELMFRHDLLESGHLGLRDTSLPLFQVLVDLVARVQPQSDVPARVVAGALWSNLHGIAQLWRWGSLQLATGADEVEPLLRAALDAHLGREGR